ncbi:MAG TPA: hypothetical protein VN776_02960 [Terracidiphilus sp.]|nr:hypothetical protein [Terracidiphilus sp.]
MHLNFHFTVVQIIWTLTFAAQLVLLVVLLGRDRIKRFPWFTLGIALMALRLLAIKLLADRMPTLTLSAIFITMAELDAIVAFLVVVEMGRRAFAPVRRSIWLACALALLVAGIGILTVWIPWPVWKTLTADSGLAILRLMQMGAQRLDMLVDLLTVGLGLLVILLGRRTGAGWRSHTQRIVIGLSTASSAQLAVEALWQFIARTAAPHSQAEYERILGLRDKLFNANGAVYIAVLIWWIACLWIDEPGGAAEPERTAPQPEYLLAEGAETPAQEADAAPTEEKAESGE